MEAKHPFKIYASRNLDHDYRAILSLLYGPIIGANSVALYHALYALVDRTQLKSLSYTHHFMYDILLISPSDFLKARKKLEATSLLSTFTHQEETLYELHLPLSAESFMKDSLLAPYLKQTIGEKRFDELSHKFLLTPLKTQDYHDISASFSDLYEPLSKPLKTSKDYINTNTKPLHIDYDFNPELFIESIPLHLIHPSAKTIQAKKRFLQLSYVYSLTEETMKECYLKSLNQDTTLDFDKLAMHASKVHKRNTVYQKRQKPYDLDYFQSTDPISVYQDITGLKVPAADAKIIDQLLMKSQLAIEVINVLIGYVLKELNQQFPVYNYFEKIVAEWHRQNIQTAEDAIQYIITKKSKKKEVKQKTYKKELPEDVNVDWFDDYLKKREEK